MKAFNEILNNTKVVGIEEQGGKRSEDRLILSHSKIGEFMVSRRLDIDSHTLLPTINLSFYNSEGAYVGGHSGRFMSEEEIYKINKMFIEGGDLHFRQESKRKDKARDNFWDTLNK